MARTHSLPAASSLPVRRRPPVSRHLPTHSPTHRPAPSRSRQCAKTRGPSPLFGRVFRNPESRNRARVCHRRLRAVKRLCRAATGVPRARGSPPHPLADVCAVRLFRGRRKNPPQRRCRSTEGGSHQQAQRILLPARRSAGRRKGKSARRRSFHAFLILRRDQSFFCSSSCCFFSSSSRRARRSTLPTMDLGSSSRNSKMRGTL